MKKTLLTVACSALILASCGNGQEDKNIAKKDLKAPEGGQLVAYVEWDSVVSQYQFCKDFNQVMAQEYENAQRTLASKQHDLEQEMASFQRKYENNAFTTHDQVNSAQASIQRKQQDLQELDARLSSQLAQNQETLTREINDSIQAFIKVYNKDGRFAYILSKSGNNILYADTTYNVTDDIVKGLNKRYQAKPEVKEKLNSTADSEDKKK